MSLSTTRACLPLSRHGSRIPLARLRCATMPCASWSFDRALKKRWQHTSTRMGKKLPVISFQFPVICLLLAACAQPPAETDAPVLVGAGDIVRCDAEDDEATAALIEEIGGTVF